MLNPNIVCRIKREALGLSQTEFSKIVGCTSGTISNYESGKEVTELVYKSIGWALRDLESKLEPAEFNDYKLRVGCECAIAEKNSKLKMTKLHSVIFNVLKYIQYLEAQERGEL